MHMNRILCLLVSFLMVICLCSCRNETGPDETMDPQDEVPEEKTIDDGTEVKPEESHGLSFEVIDEGYVISYSSQDYYRYGPSIIKYEDGTYDAWFSAPGNNSTQWDWIVYRHSDDGISWSEEQTVLKPTPGTLDQCSVCDPAVIYFDGYYYLGYTSTFDYERNGMNNSAFVARSENPDGPFEKWNGSGWGGDPSPIILYEGNPDGWGIGELSFVIKDEDLFIYYSHYDLDGGWTKLDKADLTENWPLTIREKGEVLQKDTQDSLDVVYCEDLDTFLGFSVDRRMNVDSRLIMYESKNGKEFIKADSTKKNVEDYAHNMGIAKSTEGHIDTSENILIGYAYGENWGRWDAKFQNIEIRRR